MKTILEILQLSAAYLEEKGIDGARRQAEELLAHILKLKRIDLYMQFDRPVEEEDLTLLREFIKRKGKGEPVEYITSEVEFYHTKLRLTPAVLIPRQETEILASKIAESLPDESLVVWDVCAGSGCLGISFKNARPKWNLTLSDISKEALAVAKNNAEINRIEVSFLEGDLLAPFGGKKADVIICNPPYITEEEFLSLDLSVREFEPRGALVGGPTGLEFYERLARDLPQFLVPGGKVFLRWERVWEQKLQPFFLRLSG
ncbi:MAG: peptide chain release factor N(5)-glutamine methyltransferase [Rhabdochlamydiaceae bacterium]